MSVRIVKRLVIDNYCKIHANAEGPFEKFFENIKDVNWKSLKDIVDHFGSNKVRTIGSDRLRFEIGGNNHRMIIKCQFGKRDVFFWIKFIGTKEEYDKINPSTVDIFSSA